MLQMVQFNVEQSFSAVIDGNSNRLNAVEEKEDYIDFLNKEISKYISQVIAYETNQDDSAQISSLFKISGNLERISDHATNICQYTNLMEQKHISFSKQAQQEINEMRKISLSALSLLADPEQITPDQLEEISGMEQKIDDMTLLYRQNQMQRMHEGACSDQACVLYSEMLTDFERIGDHILNIGQELLAANQPELLDQISD